MFEDLLRVLREVHRPEQADRPADVLHGVAADFLRRLVAENDKRRLDDHRELSAGNLPLQPQDVLGEIGGRERPRRRRLGGQFAPLQPQADEHRVGPGEERPELEKFRPRKPPIGPVGHGRIVKDDGVRRGVVAEHEAKVLARRGRVVVVHADDRRNTGAQIGGQRLPLRLRLAIGLLRGHSVPDGAGAKADLPQGRGEFLRIASAPLGRVEPGLVEDVILIDASAELSQPHGRAGLAAEVGFLDEEGDVP